MADASIDHQHVLAAAERLRCAGNDAFGTKDWKRAYTLYLESITQNATNAKTFANLAATCCKLGEYQEAKLRASRATSLDPKWAKGWWRSGVVNSLLGSYVEAFSHFDQACKLEPENKRFRKDRRTCLKAMGGKMSKDGVLKMDGFDKQTNDTKWTVQDKLPCKRAWNRVQQAGGFGAWFDSNRRNSGSSEAWFALGTADFLKGLRGGRACFILSTNREVHQQIGALCQAQPDNYQAIEEQILGGQGGMAIDNCVAGLINCPHGLFLGGLNPHPLVRTPSNGGCMDHLFISCAIASIGEDVRARLDSAGLSPTEVEDYTPHVVFLARESFSASMRGGLSGHTPSRETVQLAPQEAVDKLKKLLPKFSWDKGMRRLVSATFRGGILWAMLCNLTMGRAKALEHMMWADEFICCVDEQMDPHLGTQARGSAFMHSLRRSIWVPMMSMHADMRAATGCATSQGSYPVELDLVLAGAIVHSVNTHGTCGMTDVWQRVAFGRKPLAMAHAHIALELSKFSRVDLVRFSKQHHLSTAAHAPSHTLGKWFDFFKFAEDCPQSSGAGAAAYHYQQAAEQELDDADNKAIYWWGAATMMCWTGAHRDAKGTGPYTAGELRYAIRQGKIAQRKRDVGLFGEDEQAGGTYEQQAYMMEAWMSGKPDNAPLPLMILHWVGRNQAECFVPSRDTSPEGASISQQELEKLRGGSRLAGQLGRGNLQKRLHHLGTVTPEAVLLKSTDPIGDRAGRVAKSFKTQGYESSKGSGDGSSYASNNNID
jgi:tetratricopeptide (TPR) repeat protein